MSQRRAVLAVLAVLAGLALLTPATAEARTFYGKVGPGFTITLKRANGTIVHRMRHGRHTFVIRDRSSMHNFHLIRPGVDRKTGVAFTGRRRWSLRVSVGTYRYRCDPHPTTMRRRFRSSEGRPCSSRPARFAPFRRSRGVGAGTLTHAPAREVG